MKSFFQDEFINSRVLSRLAKEIKKDELDRAIEELGYLNEIQSHVISKYDFTNTQNQELEFIKKINNAKRKNIQA